MDYFISTRTVSVNNPGPAYKMHGWQKLQRALGINELLSLADMVKEEHWLGT
jgi:hypothetical protein